MGNVIILHIEKEGSGSQLVHSGLEGGGGGTENGGEAVDLSKNCMENLTRPGHTVVRQSVHNPGALPPVLEAAIFP